MNRRKLIVTIASVALAVVASVFAAATNKTRDKLTSETVPENGG